MAKPQRIAGIDYGLARIGIALSDERKILATAVPTLLAEKKTEATASKLSQELSRICQERGCELEALVIGLPLKMNGTRGIQADEVAYFADLLKQYLSCPIVLWDERLTSVQAERSMMEANFSRKKRAQHVDSVAATLILQSYLDSRSC